MALTPSRYLQLKVSDTGYGIDSKNLERIFEPYFTTKEKGKGTGLGLSMVHGIIKSHGGNVTVDSAPDAGTSFQVYLPLIPMEFTAPEPEIKEQPLSGCERLLIVDDEATIVQILQQMLISLGYEVTSLTSSAEAWNMLSKQPNYFDLVITDMAMPKMSGLELAQRYLSIRPDAPIILCTGFSESIDEEKAKMLGIAAFILKPIIKEDLAKVIRKALETG